MPTIDQLPAAAQANAGDAIPLDQAGVLHSVTVGTLLSTVQPAILVPTGSLLGRTSLGSGSPEPVTPGTGLSLAAGTLAANGGDHAGFARRTTLVTTDAAVVNTPQGPMQVPLALLTGLFSAGTNVAISAAGVISTSVPAGPQGAAGPTGAAGVRGATWTAGAGAPTAAASSGDLYLNTANGAVFQHGATSWSQIATLVGPQGPAGQTGAAGSAGAAGQNGTIWWTGSAAPASSLGDTNDLFLNTTSGSVLQKSAAGGWTQIASLVGPQGVGSITASPTGTALAQTDSVGVSLSGKDSKLPATTFGSLLPVTATVGTATTLPSALCYRFGDLPNVIRDFGAPTNGGDAAAAINAAIQAVYQRGGGAVTIPNIGAPFMLSAPVVPLSGVSLLGSGNPTLQLLPGANCAVLESQGFQTLLGTQSNAGVINCTIADLTLDGNVANQSPANPDLANGISFYGPGVKIRRVKVQNVAGHGMRLAWGQGSPAAGGVLEGVLDDIHIQGCGRHGLWFTGAPGISMHDIIVRNASASQVGGYFGFLLDTGGLLRAHNLHAYNDAAVPQTSYAASIAGSAEFTACHFAGSHQAALIAGPGAKFVDCEFYNPQAPVSGTALVDVRASGTIFVGCGFSLPAPASASTAGTPMFALSLGTSGAPVTGTLVRGCTFSEFDVHGPINFAADGGGNIIEGTGTTTNTAGTTSLTGTIAESTTIDYRQFGTRILFRNNLVVGDETRSTGNGAILVGGVSGSPSGLTAIGKDNNVGVFLLPKGAGALTAAVADGTVAGGGPRGANAVDWQTARGAASQVASGFAATICGGLQNTASGSYAAVLGGANNIADAIYSEAGGDASHTHGRQASRVWSSGQFNAVGDCQKGLAHLLRAITTGTASAYATADMQPPSGANNCALQLNSAMCVRLRAIARDYGSGAAALFQAPDLLVTCGSTRATLAFASGVPTIMTMVQSIGSTAGWGITVSPDTTYGGLLVAVTGAAARTVHWQVDPEFLELC
jgi:hypothetical protein